MPDGRCGCGDVHGPWPGGGACGTGAGFCRNVRPRASRGASVIRAGRRAVVAGLRRQLVLEVRHAFAASRAIEDQLTTLQDQLGDQAAKRRQGNSRARQGGVSAPKEIVVSAEGATPIPSVPQIPFVVFNLMLLQELQIFFLKAPDTMMFLLISDIVDHLRLSRLADAEGVTPHGPGKPHGCGRTRDGP